MDKSLHLFTAAFPYGNKSETFLETEIHSLSEVFDEIIIYPSTTDTFTREIPKNVIVNPVLSEIENTKRQKVKSILSNLGLAFKILLSEVKDKGFKTVFKNKSVLVDLLSIQLLKYKTFKNKVGFQSNQIYYDYWFVNTTLMLSIAKSKNQINQLVSRGHRFDIYDDCWDGSGVPYRSFKVININTVFCISSHGKNYFLNKINPKFHSKIKLSRLGVSSQAIIPEKTTDETPKIIVSCSSILPFKNVKLIPELLKKIDTPICWIHFGSGPDLENVIDQCASFPKNITYELKGHVSNTEIINFYKIHHIDLFLSTSNSEGLPVSMMEAQSFGIPIVAFPVGGIPEIVKDEITGFLMEENWTLEKKIDLLEKALNYNFNTTPIRDFFLQNFDSERNYTDFTEQLCSLEN